MEEERQENNDEIFDAQVKQIRNILNQNKVKLWQAPYLEDGEPNVAELINLSENISPTLELDGDVILNGLNRLQERALANLAAKNLFRESGTLQVKLKWGKSLRRENAPSHVEVSTDALGSDLQKKLAEVLKLDHANLRVISSGKVIKPDLALSNQNVRPGQTVMVLIINKDDNAVKVLDEQLQLLKDTKHDAEILGNQDSGGGPSLTIADQSGKSLDLPDDERKALIIAMSFHEKGKAAMKKDDFNLALVLLLEADSEYEKVRSELVNKVDNFGLLNLDIVWCYVQLGNMSQLEDAVDRLQKCELAFERSYGPKLERLMAVKGSAGSEKAVLFRMHLLQAIAFFHSGNPKRARDLLKIAQEECKDIDIQDDAIEEVKAMGFSQTEARIALRMTGGDVTKATELAQKKKDEMRKILQEEEERREKWHRYGKTCAGNNVNLGYMKTLQNMGFSEDYAMTALKQCDNDINQAIDLIQNQPDLLDAAILSSTVEEDNPTKSETPAKKIKASASKAALKRMVKGFDMNFRETEQHLDLDLEDEKKLLDEYKNILNLTS